eukprot:3732815-Amphidinium_carterae.2
MMQSLSSQGEGPSAIARELALDLELMIWQPILVQHKPDLLNLIFDALSRLNQPGIWQRNAEQLCLDVGAHRAQGACFLQLLSASLGRLSWMAFAVVCGGQ